MFRLVIPSFIILGVAFYYLSGGKDFTPPEVRKNIENHSVVVTPLPDTDTEPANDRISRVAAAAKQEFDKKVIESSDADLTDPTNKRFQLWSEAALSEEQPIQVASLSDLESFVAVSEHTVEPQGKDLMYVNAKRVNLRNGLGTNHNVLGKLERDTQVELLAEADGSWVKLRVIETNRVGWMSISLLRE